MNILRLIPRNTPRTGMSQADVLDRIDEGVGTMIGRGRFLGERLDFGPNWVHAMIGRGPSGAFGKPGTFEDLGWAKNLKTTVGMDWLHNTMGGVAAPTQNGPATVVTATAVTGTGTAWTASTLAGYRIWMPVTGLTTAPVYGNILSNTTSVAQIDQWWTSADGVGTTPAGTNAFQIAAGGLSSARFIALTTDTGAPAVGDTALTSEITTNGLQRALATFAHSGGATTYTLVKTFTAGGTHTAVHKAGNFTGGYGASGGGILVADTDLNADATLAASDTLQVTWTWTLPAAG